MTLLKPSILLRYILVTSGNSFHSHVVLIFPLALKIWALRVICNHCPPTLSTNSDGWIIAGIISSAITLSYSALPGMYWASAFRKINHQGIYSCKELEGGNDHWVAFSRAVSYEKILSLPFPVGVWGSGSK